MAGDALIEACLAELSRTLPRDVVDELADGLYETYDKHLSSGRDALTAATAAIAEFGDPDAITAAFARQLPARRSAVILLATGPVIGASWAATLLVAGAWTWSTPPVARIIFGLVLVAAVGALITAIRVRHPTRQLPLTLAGQVGLVLLDSAMLITVLHYASFAWPMAIAVPASLTRLLLTSRLLAHGLLFRA